MSNLRPGDVLENRYRIDRLLGEGGMSWVYRGHHLLLQHPVAVKVIKPLYSDPAQAREHSQQLRVEAGIMARLDHPNLVRAFDMFEHGDQSVLILEMLEGRNLDEVAELAPKPISERRVLAWTAQILDALEYLHSQDPPVIVRDLKPGNVMLGKDGRIRLIDFGLAKQMDQQGAGTRAFVRGMGSEGYAPLEQYAQSSTDGRSDLYALGATMYFLLTKIVPPPASLRIADEAQLVDPRTINPSVTSGTWSAILALLALRADDRPADAATARRALELPGPRDVAPESQPLPTAPVARAPGKRCATCDLLLRPSIHHGVEVDCCRECGGVWLDRGELGRLVQIGRGAEPSGAGFSQPARARGSSFPGTDDLSRPLNTDFLDRQSHSGDSRRFDSRDDSRDRSRASEGQRYQQYGHRRRSRGEEALRGGLYRVWKVLEELLD
jgi:serine/threonine-protein kinase